MDLGLSEETIERLSIEEVNYYLEARVELYREKARVHFAVMDYYLLKSAQPTKADGKTDTAKMSTYHAKAQELYNVFCSAPKEEKKLTPQEKLELLAAAFPGRGVALMTQEQLDGQRSDLSQSE